MLSVSHLRCDRLVTVSVNATDALGVTSSAKTVVVAVNPVPTVTAPTASPNPTDVGKAVALATTASGGTGALTCGWNFGDGSASIRVFHAHSLTPMLLQARLLSRSMLLTL